MFLNKCDGACSTALFTRIQGKRFSVNKGNNPFLTQIVKVNIYIAFLYVYHSIFYVLFGKKVIYWSL